MLTLELMTELKIALGKFKELDKAKIIKVFEVLTEFKAIEKEVTELKKLIRKLGEEKQIEKYIEANGIIYCLETLEQFELINEKESNLTDIAEIVKQINKQTEVIGENEQKLADLYSEKEILINKIFLDAKNKAVKNTKLLIIQGNINDKIIFLED